MRHAFNNLSAGRLPRVLYDYNHQHMYPFILYINYAFIAHHRLQSAR